MNTLTGTILAIVLIAVTFVGMKTYQGSLQEQPSESVEVVETEGPPEAQQQLDKTVPVLDTDAPIELGAYRKRAIAHSQAGRYHEALDDLEIYLKHRPGDMATAKVYGRALLEAAEFERAVEFYGRAVETNPSNVNTLFSLAWAYEQSGQFAKAIESYEKVLAFDPRRVVCRNNVAWILATAPDDSLRNGQQALEMALDVRRTLRRDEAWLGDTLAAALAETGDFAAAVKVQKWATQAAPADKRGDMQKRLQLYQQKKPYRLPKRPGDALKPSSSNAA